MLGPQDFAFTYILLTDNINHDESQVFMGYTASTLGIGKLITATTHLRPTIFHLHLNFFKIAKLKIRGLAGHRVIPLSAEALSSIDLFNNCIFPVILSDSSLDEHAARTLRTVNFPVLHLKSKVIDEIFKDPNKGRLALRKFAREVSKFRGGHISETIDSCLKRRNAQEIDRIIPRIEFGHGVTCINEIPLKITGGNFYRKATLHPGNEDRYITAIRESVEALNYERNRMIRTFKRHQRKSSIDLIIAAPGLLHHLSSGKKFLSVFGRQENKQMMDAYRYHIEQVSYFNNLDATKLTQLYKNPFFVIFAKRWKSEIETFTAVLAFQAFANFCPVIRLPRRIYRIREKLSLLGSSLRSKSPKLHSINRSTNRVILELNKELEPYNDFFEGANKHIRICSDIPLGLTQHDGLSLSLKHCVSYLPTTPGNLFVARAFHNEMLGFNISSTIPVTVIRSFLPGDKIRRHMEKALVEYSKQHGWDIKLEIIDVSTEEEFINACNACKSRILIFDGHGGHSDNTQIGSIIIGGKNLDIWRLKGKITIPPIVILSCCDSSSSDRSHASSALGFLTLGAASVLGAMFPIGATEAALFVARLLYKLTSTTRILISVAGRPMSWSELVTCQLRASYLSEFMRLMVRSKIISQAASLGIEPMAVTDINKFVPEWHEKMVSRVASKSNCSADKIKAVIREELALPHALQYVHFGNPEQITLFTDEFIARSSKPK